MIRPSGPGTRRSLQCAGCAQFANKLDAIIFLLLLEVGWSDQPLQDLQHYNEMVINNVSDQGLVWILCCLSVELGRSGIRDWQRASPEFSGVVR